MRDFVGEFSLPSTMLGPEKALKKYSQSHKHAVVFFAMPISVFSSVWSSFALGCQCPRALFYFSSP